jgi:hypothetical protein
VRSFTLLLPVKPALSAPATAYDGYPFIVSVALAGAPTGTAVAIERKVSATWIKVAGDRIELSVGTCSASQAFRRAADGQGVERRCRVAARPRPGPAGRSADAAATRACDRPGRASTGAGARRGQPRPARLRHPGRALAGAQRSSSVEASGVMPCSRSEAAIAERAELS